MDAIDKVADPLESLMADPMYVDTRPFILAAVLLVIYLVVNELPAMQRYMNMNAMARDHKPMR